MGTANIFIAKLVGILFILSAFINFRRGSLGYLNLKKGDLMFTIVVFLKFAAGLALIILPNIQK